jgi:hypothetical protein
MALIAFDFKLSAYDLILLSINSATINSMMTVLLRSKQYLPYVSSEVRMDPKTEVCLYPCGGYMWGMWGCVCSNRHGRHTTRFTIQLTFWQISDNVLLIMFGTRQDLLKCSIKTSANAEYKNSALLQAALKQAPYLLCEAS